MEWDPVTEEKCQGQTDISGLLRILGFRFSVFSNFGQRFERNCKHHFRGRCACKNARSDVDGGWLLGGEGNLSGA